jgi:hypothetical protein
VTCRPRRHRRHRPDPAAGLARRRHQLQAGARRHRAHVHDPAHRRGHLARSRHARRGRHRPRVHDRRAGLRLDGIDLGLTGLKAKQFQSRSWLFVGDQSTLVGVEAIEAAANAYETDKKRPIYAKAQLRDRKILESSRVRAALVPATDATLTFAEVGGTGDTITRTAGSFVTDGFQAGDYIRVTGSLAEQRERARSPASPRRCSRSTPRTSSPKWRRAARSPPSPRSSSPRRPSPATAARGSSEGFASATRHHRGQRLEQRHGDHHRDLGDGPHLRRVHVRLRDRGQRLGLGHAHRVDTAHVAAMDALVASVDDSPRIDIGFGRLKKRARSSATRCAARCSGPTRPAQLPARREDHDVAEGPRRARRLGHRRRVRRGGGRRRARCSLHLRAHVGERPERRVHRAEPHPRGRRLDPLDDPQHGGLERRAGGDAASHRDVRRAARSSSRRPTRSAADTPSRARSRSSRRKSTRRSPTTSSRTSAAKGSAPRRRTGPRPPTTTSAWSARRSTASPRSNLNGTLVHINTSQQVQ